MNTFSLKREEYPALGYFFEVKFHQLGPNDFRGAFQSITGISKSTKAKKIADGGDNDYEYKLPINSSYKDITLKRGIVKSFGKNFNKDVTSWFVNLGFMYNGSTPRLYPTQVEIYLLDTDQKNLGEPLEKWSLYHCYPTSVTMGEFNSTKSDIAIETITLSYSRYIRTVF